MSRIRVPALLVLLIAVFFSFTSAKSIISTFTDANCQDVYSSLDGPNGYPNGSCTDFRRSGTYGSFMVVGLDTGCSVTIYQDDFSGDICSGPQLVASIARCYNSTWSFYSIDMCDPAAAGNTDVPTLILSPTSLSTSSPTSTSSLTSDTAAATSSAASQASSGGGGSNTGAIVGGVVGGVLGLAIIIGATVFITARTMRKKMADDVGASEVNEMHADSMMGNFQKPVVYEKMGNVPDLPPVELPVDEGGPDTGTGAKPPSR